MTQRSSGPAAPTDRPARDRRPSPPASLGRLLLRQSTFETRLLLRNGEQLLLTLAIPILLLVVLAKSSLLTAEPGSARVDLALPSVLAVAVVATSFTSLAIATGFERRYQALRRMAVTPLPRWGLLAGKAGSVLTVQAVQLVLLLAVATALGWDPHGAPAAVLVLVLVGSTAFSALGLLLAGTLRAEATLAAANLLFLLLVVLGGLVVPLDQHPDQLRPLISVLPSAALAEGLRAAFAGTWALTQVGVLVVWSGALAVATARTFRWD